jgi:carbonic anhydrase
MCETCRNTSLQFSRRGLLLGAAATAAMLLSKRADAKETKAPPKPQNVLSPDASLDRLLKGNARYVEGVSLRHDFKHEREALAGGQNPYAAILSCADSRIAPEYAFDSGRGDLFVCRVAGNFANAETIASLEYAVAVLAVPLILVLGHDSCGEGGSARRRPSDRCRLAAAAPAHATTGTNTRAMAIGIGRDEGRAEIQLHERHGKFQEVVTAFAMPSCPIRRIVAPKGEQFCIT